MDRFYKYLRWLSLDIVVGAIFFLAYLERFYQTTLSWNAYFALASAIWLIYTADHLLDVRSLPKPTSARHLFHKKHFKLLVLIAGTVLSLGLLNLYFVEIEIIRNGAILSAICVSYLLLVYFFRKLWIKEVLVAVVYATGIFIGPWSMLDGLITSDFLILLQLVGIAFLNLMIFSYYDRASDKQDGFNSIVLRLRERNAQSLIYGISLLIVVSTLVMGLGHQIQVLYLMMTMILAIVYLKPNQFAKTALYRTVGDGIFYLPGLFLLL
ncbi:UbiA family prenyltransferase [Marinoscillum sp.]|uniref:UbiA family prenyltransferase n=1 Tax=Marinoscillum sp. TaxID=2024838 RepID=UPI003BA95629